MFRQTDQECGQAETDALTGLLNHQMVPVNGLHLHVVSAGPEDGSLVVLLHGFPEFWYGWRHQIPALAAAGYHVWAPDQRGYNLSDKPKDVADYRIDILAQDVMALIEAAGHRSAAVVGHDWGALVGWWLAEHNPDCLKHFVAINVPHGQVMDQHLRHSPRQLLRSWYAIFFQIPWLPEAILGARGGALMSHTLVQTSRPGTFTPQALQRYRDAWAKPGAMRSMVNWYRAAGRFHSSWRTSRGSRITVPTLLIWGAEDRFLRLEMAAPSIEHCDRGRLVVLERATHWVHHEEPTAVNALIAETLTAGRK